MTPFGALVIAICAFGLSTSNSDTSSAQLIAWYAPAIAGCALVMGPAQSFALSQMTPRLYPHGSTVVGTSFQLAGCIGSSLFMGLYGIVSMLGQQAGLSATQAATNGFRYSCWAGVALNVIGVILVLFIGRLERRAKQADNGDLAALKGQTEAGESKSKQHHHELESCPGSETVTAAQVMNREVFSVRDTDTADQVLRQLVARQTSGLPVLDQSDRLVGFVTDGAVLRALSGETHDSINMSYVYALWTQGEGLTDRIRDLRNVPVTDLCYKRVTSIDINDDLRYICEVLSDSQIKKYRS